MEEWTPPPLPPDDDYRFSFLSSFTAPSAISDPLGTPDQLPADSDQGNRSDQLETRPSHGESLPVAKRDRWQKRDPGKELRKAADKGDYDTCLQLLGEGVSVDDRDNGGRTALHYAARGGQVCIAKLLLDSRADPNAPDKHNSHPIFEADYWYSRTKSKSSENPVNYLTVIEYLVERGAVRTPDAVPRHGTETGHSQSSTRNRSKTDSGKLLRKAAEDGDHTTCLELLRAGVPVDDRDGGGKTALHNAARGAQPYIVNLLLEWKANPNAEDRNGSLPCDEADHWYVKVKCGYRSQCRAEDYEAAIEILVSYGARRSDVTERQKLDPSFGRRLERLEQEATAVGVSVPWKTPCLLDLPTPARSSSSAQPDHLESRIYQVCQDYYEPPEKGYLPVNIGDKIMILDGRPVAGEPGNRHAWYVFGESGASEGWLSLDAVRCTPLM